MGKKADLTTGQKTIIDTLQKMGKPQKLIAKEAGCSQSAVSKHINVKFSGRAKCGRKRCTAKRDDRGLQRIVKQKRFNNLAEIHPGDGLQQSGSSGQATSDPETTQEASQLGQGEEGLDCWPVVQGPVF